MIEQGNKPADKGKAEMNVNKEKETIEKTKEVPKKYLLIYSSGRTKTQSVLFPDTIEQYNSRELTSLIELTGMLLFQGGTEWAQIPHMDYTPPVPAKVEPTEET